MKKEYLMEGLNCTGCAGKIERLVGKLDGVNKVEMNFNTSTYKLDIDEKLEENIDKDIRKIVNDLEPHVNVIDKSKAKKIIKKEYFMEGLNCTGCAGKIERLVGKLDGVNKVEMNFNISTYKLEIEKIHEEEIDKEVRKIVNELEPHVKVIDKSKKKKGNRIDEEVKKNRAESKKKLIRMIIGGIIFILALIFEHSLSIAPLLFLASYLTIGKDILVLAFRNIKAKQIMDENFLMVVASFAAFGIKAYEEAVLLVLLYQIGEYLKGRAVNSSRQSVSELMDIRPDYANLVTEDGENKVDPEEVKLGDIIIIKPGEKVALDGKVVEGVTSVNTSALTGESLPVNKETGDEVLSGSINIDGVIKVEVTKEFGESTVSKILELVEESSSNKARTEQQITTFAKYYTPIVILLAIGMVVLSLFSGDSQAISDTVYRAATLLVISCPCALVISVPMAYFTGIGASSREGILVKGGTFLDVISKVDTVVMDKTGTLTEGKFVVTEVITNNEIAREELIELTAHVESLSNHPIAQSIVVEYGKDINKDSITNYKEIAGKGVQASFEGKEIVSGNAKLMKEYDIKEFNEVEGDAAVVYTAIDGVYAGCILIEDKIKEDSKASIAKLKELGIKNTVMLTGDRREVANKVGSKLGIDTIHSELLPSDKVELTQDIMNSKKNLDGHTMFIGDGINDAPVLAGVDVGVAMGALGSDAAVEAADVVLMSDEIGKIPIAVKIARKTKKIVVQNIVLSIGLKLVVLVLTLRMENPSMMLALFSDVGMALITVLNSMRILKQK